MTEFDHWGSLRGAEEIEIIVPASAIPIGSTVRKITGTRSFILGDKLVLYTENGVKKEIAVDSTARILLSSGSFVHNTIGSDKKLVWITDPTTLWECLERTPQ
ncbi:MAG: hypothetical protein ACR2QF_15955 [Geminicoccaceae bacterium]